MMRRGRIPNYRFGCPCTKRASNHVAWLKISTGPLDFGLDDSTGISCGVMNYELGVVSSEFHVLVRFRRFALQLKALGIDAELMAPIHAVLKTEGKILPDHSFNGGLRGSCKVESHKMFSAQYL